MKANCFFFFLLPTEEGRLISAGCWAQVFRKILRNGGIERDLSMINSSILFVFVISLAPQVWWTSGIWIFPLQWRGKRRVISRFGSRKRSSLHQAQNKRRKKNQDTREL